MCCSPITQDVRIPPPPTRVSSPSRHETGIFENIGKINNHYRCQRTDRWSWYLSTTTTTSNKKKKKSDCYCCWCSHLLTRRRRFRYVKFLLYKTKKRKKKKKKNRRTGQTIFFYFFLYDVRWTEKIIVRMIRGVGGGDGTCWILRLFRSMIYLVYTVRRSFHANIFIYIISLPISTSYYVTWCNFTWS